jgi:hypothetical protein
MQTDPEACSRNYTHKIDFKSKLIRRNKEHIIVIKVTIKRKSQLLTIINICVANISIHNYISSIGHKPQKDPNKMILEDFSAPRSLNR